MARSLDNVLSSIPDAIRWKLDQEMIPQHIGMIADLMVGWEGVTAADLLGLSSEADRCYIKEKYPNQPSLQGYKVIMI